MTTDFRRTVGRTPSSPVSKSTHVPEILRDVGISEAVQELHNLDARYGLIPAVDRARLLTVIADIQRHADVMGLSSVADLLTQHNELLMCLSGTTSLSQFHKLATSDCLHLCRNLILTLAALALGLSTGDLATMQTPRRPDDFTQVYALIAKMAPRTHSLRRPLTTDEILLLRTNVFLRSCSSPQHTPAVVYSFVEAGMTPGETTIVSLDDIDDDEAPEMVLAAGNAHVESRFLPLDRFGSLILQRFLATGLKPERAHTHSLTYEGRKNAAGSWSATASAQGVIDRLLKELGLFNDDTSATSVRLWRLETAYLTDGATFAQEMGGYGREKHDLDRLWRALGHVAKPTKEEPDEEEESFLD